ncbi:response regulator transcription factor [Paenibacillus campi]|uniref:response regulator transcription factor n=1 Tax=Paenibacillus campi TaxID=3106031 RepID=UPI002AFF7D16|nr:response regulator [Paenibacillus sp. SGZ-1014]
MHDVLLVDDEPFALEGLELMIDWHKYGFRIDGVCSNGEEAIAYLRDHTPALIVTDICMPVMDGLDLIRAARRLGNTTSTFVIASGYHDFEYARQAMRLGVSHYLLKPVIGPEVDGVLTRVQQQLAEQSRRELICRTADEYTIRQHLATLIAAPDAGAYAYTEQELTQLFGAARRWWSYVYLQSGAGSGSAAYTEALRLAAEQTDCYVLSDRSGSFGIVKGWHVDEAATASEQTGQLCQQLKRCLPDGTRIAAGIPVDDLRQLHESYGDARAHSRLLFFDEHNDEAAETKQVTVAEPPTVSSSLLAKAEAISEAVENGDTTQLCQQLQQQFEHFRTDRTAPEWVSIFSNEVVLRCVSLYAELGGASSELLAPSELEQITCVYSGLKLLEERLTEFCLRCQQAVAMQQDTQTGGVQAQVADFLRQHYTETWTIRELAEKFYIHPVYLGQSFARRYGMSILDFVHELRIEEAKRLLTGTELAFCTVAEQTGYRGYQHFLKQFEKRTGYRPSDYRQRYEGVE